MQYYEVTLFGQEKDYNEVLSWLLDHGVDTFREETPSLVDELNSSEIQWDYVDDNLLNTKKGQLFIQFYPSEEEKGLIKEFENYVVKNDLGEVGVRELQESDWANDWKKYFQPFDLGENLAIVPYWSSYETSRQKILIDPGMAFGSGSHETTYFCLEMLEKYVHQGDLVYDVGCGSGILSVASSILGASRVQGVDIDPLAIEASYHNSQLNSCENCDFSKGDLLANFQEKADLVVSNIFAEIIIGFLGDLDQCLKRGGIFIASGILTEKKPAVMEALKNQGFSILEDHDKNDWSVIVARAKND